MVKLWWFSHQNCHSYGSKLWQFQCKSTALLGANYGGFGVKLWWGYA